MQGNTTTPTVLTRRRTNECQTCRTVVSGEVFGPKTTRYNVCLSNIEYWKIRGKFCRLRVFKHLGVWTLTWGRSGLREEFIKSGLQLFPSTCTEWCLLAPHWRVKDHHKRTIFWIALETYQFHLKLSIDWIAPYFYVWEIVFIEKCLAPTCHLCTCKSAWSKVWYSKNWVLPL